MSTQAKHPDPDRHWNRKWEAAKKYARIGVAILFIDLFAAVAGDAETAANVHRVTLFAVPMLFVFMLAYFGISEWNNQTRMKRNGKDKAENN